MLATPSMLSTAAPAGVQARLVGADCAKHACLCVHLASVELQVRSARGTRALQIEYEVTEKVSRLKITFPWPAQAQALLRSHDRIQACRLSAHTRLP